MKKTLMAILCAALLLTLVSAAFYMNRKEETIVDAGISKTAPVKVESLTFQGVEYPLKKHLQTVLLIGTDSTEPYVEKPESERDFFSYHQADYLVLLVIDKDSGKAETIQINRDTMTDVPWLDVFGDYGGTEYKQLCLSFNYGDGGPTSCQNTVNAVSSLLFNLPIGSYIQIPMVAVSQLNDLVGGVPVTITDDMTVVDPEFVQGRTVKLMGEQAEKFVRARTSLADDTNTSRMRRQRDYMDSFLKRAEVALQSDPQFAVRAIEKLGNWFQSNMTVTQMSELVQSWEKSDAAPIRHPDGELLVGARFYEFYVDEASLWEIVRGACCE